MTIDQLDMFPETAQRVRTTDPATSHAAAAAVDVPARAGEVLAALRSLPTATPSELVVRLRRTGIDMDQNCVARRLGDLEAAGLAARTGDTRPGRSGRQQTVWTSHTEGA